MQRIVFQEICEFCEKPSPYQLSMTPDELINFKVSSDNLPRQPVPNDWNIIDEKWACADCYARALV